MFFVVLVLMTSVLGIPRLLDPLKGAEIQMGMAVIFSISTLIILLYYVAAGFSELNLANSQRALGLPEGSVRALIALFLIMIFIIVSIYLFRTVSGQTGIVLGQSKK